MCAPTLQPSRDLRLALWASGFTQFLCALVLGGRLHHDEVFQYLEQAHRLAFGFGVVPHEYHVGMRNWLAPGALAALFKTLRALGVSDSRVLVGVTQALVGALSLASIASAHKTVLHATGSRTHARLAALSLALWIPCANLAFRTLGEGFSVITVMAALAALTPLAGAPLTDRNAFTAGLWVGLGFVFRYAAGVYALPIALVLAWRREPRALAVFCAGVMVPVAGLGALDGATWGDAWHSVRAYADYNLVRGRASIDYGARPAWFYALCALGLSPVGLFALSAPRWRDRGRGAAFPLAVAGGYLAVMSALAHKEPRFFLPIVPVMIVAAVIARARWSAARVRLALALVIAHSLAALGVMFALDVCQGEEARAAQWIGRQPDVGAVAALSTFHPGYVLLRRDVPVFFDLHGSSARALDALTTRWRHAGTGRFYVYFAGRAMPGETRQRLATMGFSRVQTVGRAEVWAR